MTKEDNLREVARLMRESADLIERGVITDIQIDIEFGHVTRPDPKTGGYTMRHVSTGERTVTIKLRGNDFQRADWAAAASNPDGLPFPRRLIPGTIDPVTGMAVGPNGQLKRL